MAEEKHKPDTGKDKKAKEKGFFARLWDSKRNKGMLIFLLFFFCLTLFFSSLSSDQTEFTVKMAKEAENSITYHTSKDNTHFLFKPETWVALFKEFTFAIFIALAISVGIEETSRKEFNSEISQRMRDIQKNVFLSTYGRRVDKKVLARMEKLVLEADFMRRGHIAEYSISVIDPQKDFDPPLQLEDTSSVSFVSMHVETSYEVKNISDALQDFEVKLKVEKPPYDRLKDYAQISNVVVAGKKFTPEEIAQQTQSTKDELIFTHTVKDIRPGDSIDVFTNSRMLKDDDDVEIWRSIYPSDGMTLVVRFPAEVNHSGALPLHDKPLHLHANDGPNGRKVWKMKHGVLPHQGIVFWWRCSNKIKQFCEPEDVT